MVDVLFPTVGDVGTAPGALRIWTLGDLPYFPRVRVRTTPSGIRAGQDRQIGPAVE